jgi:hypothetical protein
MHTSVCLGNVKRRDDVGEPYVTESIIVNGSARNTGRGCGLDETDKVGKSGGLLSILY